MLKKYVAFVGLCLGFFLVMMDITTVPLIYVPLMKVFNVSPVKVAWINNIYLITYAAFLLLGGRLGDSTNRKMVVLIAYLALSGGAAISGAGQTLTDIIMGRALMGVGAGLLTPQSMAYISIIFAKSGRGTALGIWGTVAGVATATGPIITQIFLSIADWRWVMWVNIPVVIICFLIAICSLPNDSGRGIKVWDIVVSSLYGICLAGAIVGVQFMSSAGPTATLGCALFIIGATIATLLIKNDRKRKLGYILSSELWFDGTFLNTCLISGLLGLGVTAFYLPLVFLLDVRMNFGPVAMSAVMITISLSNAVVGPFAGNISDRIQPEIIIRLGLILFAVANVLLGLIGVFVPAGTLAFIALCVTMVIGGIGTGFAFAPLANLALGRAQITTVGRAAAFYNSVRQVSSALGGVIMAITFDLVVRLQLGFNFEVTNMHLRQASQATAIASLVCFLFIAFSLVIAAYMSRSNKQESLDELNSTKSAKEI